MHQPIRDNLEDYLEGFGSARSAGSFTRTLESAGNARERSGCWKRSRELLQSLRPPEMEPRAGFYARVMERIEAQQSSIWSVFLDRKFGLRLAVASAALALLMGTYLVSSGPGGLLTFRSNSGTHRHRRHRRQSSAGRWLQQHQRDAVLVDLASLPRVAPCWHQPPSWQNPRILTTLVMVFLTGALVGAVTMRVGMQNRTSIAPLPRIGPTTRRFSPTNRLQKELNLTSRAVRPPEDHPGRLREVSRRPGSAD